MILRQITDPKLAQNAYLIGSQTTKEAVVVDPLRDVDQYMDAAKRDGLRIVAVAETHIHADYLSGVQELAERTGARIYVSAGGGPSWSYRWTEGRGDVTLLNDGDEFAVGNVTIRAVSTPGHTPEHVSFSVSDGDVAEAMGVLSGDFVFAGDLGRPDLLESAAGEAGSREAGAHALFASVNTLLGWPDWLQVWPGHGAGSACGKALGAVPQTTAGYEKRFNDSVQAALQGEAEFVRAILDGQNEPPLYFARMKRLNRDGVPPLPALPRPRQLEPSELGTWAGRTDAYVLDTRAGAGAFMQRHLPGSLFAPLNRTFPTVAGSLVAESEAPICLIVEEGRVEEAVRDLVRIGLDNVHAFATPASVEAYFAAGGPAASIEEIASTQLEERRSAGGHVLDVRYGPEYDERHIPDAVHVPHTRLAERIGEVPDDGPVYVHCQGGSRAAVASAFLQRAGYDPVFVSGPFAAWQPAVEGKGEEVSG